LSDAYVSENRLGESSKCIKDADEIFEQQKNKFKLPLVDWVQKPLTNSYFKEICYWANKVEECKDAIGENSFNIKYAKTVNALCEFLCLAGLHDVALLQYEEALSIILPKSNEKIEDSNLVYMILVILLKIAICAKETGNETLSRKYCIMPFFYLAGFSMGKNNDMDIDWQYLTELCRELIDKI